MVKLMLEQGDPFGALQLCKDVQDIRASRRELLGLDLEVGKQEKTESFLTVGDCNSVQIHRFMKCSVLSCSLHSLKLTW